MNNKSSQPPPSSKTKWSVLLPVGIILMVLGLLAPRALSQIAVGIEPATLRRTALILTELLRLAFFGGVICVVIAFLRRR